MLVVEWKQLDEIKSFGNTYKVEITEMEVLIALLSQREVADNYSCYCDKLYMQMVCKLKDLIRIKI